MSANGDGDIDVSDEALQKFLGTSSFGRQDRRADPDRQIEQSRLQKHAALKVKSDSGSQSASEASDKDESDASSNSDPDSDDDEPEFPVTHSIKLPTHTRAVTAATLDPSGVRMVTGSLDSTLKFHDLSSLTPSTIRAFKSVDPSNPKPTASSNAESHAIHSVAFNPLSPSTLLVIDATAQPKILDRDGNVLSEFVKGDMYLRDMNNTKGHVSETTSGVWHPTRKEIVVTAGTDSTLRIWDIERPRQQSEVVVFKSKAAGSAGRSRMTAVVWGAQSGDGAQNALVGAALDGTLVLYQGEGPYSRPAAEIRGAHKPGTWTGGIDISPDGRLVVTRGGDDTIKVWDLRKFKTPVNTVQHESTSSQYPTSNIRFSPSGGNIITGGADGSLYILNPATLRPEATTPVTPDKPLITVLWHQKLNQIVAGSANAETHILYNPEISNNGAKLIMSKAPKRRHIDDDPSLTTDMSQGIASDAIIVPGGTIPSSASFASRHPNVGLTASGKSRDPRRPHQPATTPFAKSNPDEGYVRNQIPLSSMRDEDPREALLKYADKAKNDPVFTAAWSKTQPKTIYGDLSDEDEDEERESKRIKK
ncbi:WD repeat protein [Myriangium duriaei CBS 260.36]|uniref:WD repeat protein n=1 Tax=Myriangium duriaei CBS 260.36 TaxID=1168546 RepID=A0A9P4MSZ9_9PEZI|nr:WD repeat protein [Myriangium duriaei CBS 260.36]